MAPKTAVGTVNLTNISMEKYQTLDTYGKYMFQAEMHKQLENALASQEVTTEEFVQTLLSEYEIAAKQYRSEQRQAKKAATDKMKQQTLTEATKPKKATEKKASSEKKKTERKKKELTPCELYRKEQLEKRPEEFAHMSKKDQITVLNFEYNKLSKEQKESIGVGKFK